MNSDQIQQANTQALLRMADSMHQQTQAFTSAMKAQTDQIARLSEKVDTMQARVIRLEEQRHGTDIQNMTKNMETLMTRVAALEILRAKGEGIGMFMTWMRQFMPWLAAIAVAGLIALGFEWSGEP